MYKTKRMGGNEKELISYSNVYTKATKENVTEVTRKTIL
jgi:hypothetical protein